MDYVLLETFVVVSDTRNLTRASEILFRTQPTITNRIKTLENQLGFDLLSRNKGKRNVNLTDKGREFLLIAKQLLGFYNRIVDIQNDAAKIINIGAIDSIGTTIVSDVSRLMHHRNKDILINIKTYQTREAYDLIARRELDIAFVSQPVVHPSIVCEAIFRQDLYVVKAASSVREPLPIRYQELETRNEIYHSWGTEYDNWHKSIWGSTSKPLVTVDSCTLLAQFLLYDYNWAIVQAGNIPLLSRYINPQIFVLNTAPPQRICYMVVNACPDRSTIPLIKMFRTLMTDYISSPENKYFL